MNVTARDFDAMLLLTYAPPPDTNLPAYEDWLRSDDNPFFNAVPGIVEYTNWKIVAGAPADFPYSYFDFMGIESVNAVDEVWQNEALQEFATAFRRKWRVVPAHVYLCERLAVPKHPRTNHVIFLPGETSAGQSMADYDTWRVIRSVRGDLRFEKFDMRFISDRGEFDQVRTRPASPPSVALLGECIASPD